MCTFNGYEHKTIASNYLTFIKINEKAVEFVRNILFWALLREELSIVVYSLNNLLFKNYAGGLKTTIDCHFVSSG